MPSDSLGAPTTLALASASPARLTLYYYPSCPFCSMVQRAASRLGVSLVLRDIHQDLAALTDLRSVMGRSTVPVLRIERTGEGGRSAPDQWLPESGDIVQYLRDLGASGHHAKG